MATSPPAPIPRIDRLIQVEGNLYASDTDYSYGGFIARGREGGVLWEFIWDESVSEQVQRALDEEVAMPIIVCNPLDEQTCYRITGQEEIEVSSDGGQTWEIAWRVPPGRRAFLDYSAGDKQVDLGPYDMLFFEQQGTSCLLVAMGNEGVMRRCMPDGPWERYAVYEARPTSFFEEDVVDALFIMRRKVNIWIGITLLILVFSCSVGWRSIVGRVKMDKEKGDSGRWVLSPVIVTTILGALSGILSGVAWEIGMSSPITIQFLREPFLVGLALLPLAGFVLTWRRIASLIGSSQVVRIALWCLLTTLLSLVSGVTPQVLWATGTIAHYTTAQSIAGLCTIVFVIGGLSMVYLTGKGLSIQLDVGQDS